MDDFIEPDSIKQQLNKDCLEYIQKNSNLIANSLSFLFDASKRQEFFHILSDSTSSLSEYDDQDSNSDPFAVASTVSLNNSLNRFIQLYVPLDYMKHLSVQTKLNLITQFLLTNKTEESKIELIIDLANYYAQNQEWDLVLNLLNNSTQDNEELNELNHRFGGLNQSENANSITSSMSEDGKFSQKDLYNLFDHACICRAYQEAKKNEKSFLHLFRMKNFLRQIRAIFGLMYLWNIDECLLLIEYCLTKSKLYEQPGYCHTTELTDNYASLVFMINNKKIEFTAYKELVTSARQTLEQYYEHQQIQDAAGFYDNNDIASESTVNLNKMKRVCQKCLTWQFAKNQLESSSSRDDEETNELIMDLFLLNDKFTSAKYLIRKLNLSKKLQFKLDFGHLKHRLLNLNASSSIIVIDLVAILSECISFGKENNSTHNVEKNYEFEICYRLLNELKDLNELNNQVLISLSEYLIENYKHLLGEHQLKEFKIIQLTARIFQILVQRRAELPFDSYKRHHSSPLLIIEQLLMNSQIELAKKTIKLCRDAMATDAEFLTEINQLLVRYARKALEFKVYINSKTKKDSESEDTLSAIKSRSPQLSNTDSIQSKSNTRKSSVSINITLASNNNNNNNNNSNNKLSSSFKSFYKFSSLGINSNSSNNNLNITNSNANQQSSSLNTILSPNNILGLSSSSGNSGGGGSFVMPATAPSKEDWVKDDDVQECMVCNTRRFSLLNRRHHCRRCGRVVCSNCSERVTLIDNIPRRTCDDCFRQIELQKTNEKFNSMDKSSEIFSTSLTSKSYLGKSLTTIKNKFLM
jgi:hypothetical protein